MSTSPWRNRPRFGRCQECLRSVPAGKRGPSRSGVQTDASSPTGAPATRGALPHVEVAYQDAYATGDAPHDDLEEFYKDAEACALQIRQQLSESAHMRRTWSTQYVCSCLLLKGDAPEDWPSFQRAMRTLVMLERPRDAESDEYCLRIISEKRDVGPELYSESALRRMLWVEPEPAGDG